jgi:diguanylate cyclase (GGDEF)-like protein
MSAMAEEILTISTDIERLDNFSIEILEDKHNSLSVDDALQQSHWKTSSNSISLGYSASTFWLKLSIENPTEKQLNSRLLFTESFLKRVDLYQKIQGSWVISPNGSRVPIANRKIAHQFPTFTIQIPKNTQSTLLIKLESDFGLFGSLLLLSSEEFYQQALIKDSVHMFMFGALWIIALYNLFLWVNLKDVIYFYYVAYITFYSLWLSTYSGHILFITPPSFYALMNTALPIAFIFLILFSQRLLTTKKIMPKTHLVLTFMAICFGLSAIFIPIATSLSFQMQNTLAVLLLPFLLITGIRSIRNKVNNAKIYSIALLLYFIGLTILGLMALGILPYNDFTRYAPFPGSLFEITLFSFALANRINQHKQRAIDAQSNLLLMQQNANKELEQKVKERTHKLNEQKKQLEHLSLTDSLTNIYNRRAFRDIFEDSNDNLKAGQKLTLIMVDIDYFKGFNDAYGHQAGDDALVRVAKILDEHASLLDGNAFRLGGEEFALLYFSEDKEGALHAAQICRQSVFDLAIENNASEFPVITISLGVIVTLKENYYTMAQMYKLADEALYQAKNTGRNKVVLSKG